MFFKILVESRSHESVQFLKVSRKVTVEKKSFDSKVGKNTKWSKNQSEILVESQSFQKKMMKKENCRWFTKNTQK